MNTHSNLCSARKSDGTPCKAYPIRGANVCRVHGGSAPQVKAAAKAKLAEAKIRQEASKYVANAGELADPLGELLRVAGEMVAWKDWLGERVATLNSDEYRYKSGQGLEQLRSEITLYQQAMAQVAKVIESMAKLDLEARRTRIQERDVTLMMQLVERTLARLGVRLDGTDIWGILAEEARALDAEEAHHSGRGEPAALTRAR